jgi:sialate O-acetylesterase
MNTRLLNLVLAASIFLRVTFAASADVSLPHVFSPHMVLMKSTMVPVWGKADAAEQITVTLNGKRAQATTAANGKWKVVLDLNDSGPGPFEMTVAGKNTITISDVAVGQVWMTSGQSNMQLPLKLSANGSDEAAKSANSLIRLFRVPSKGSDVPLDDCAGTWTVAGPDTSADYSAIGYYFAKKLQQQLRQPIGIIDTSWGGTIIEAWSSQQVLDEEPAFKAGEDARRKLIADFPPLKAKWVRDYGEWLTANGRHDKPCLDPAAYNGDDINTADWTPVTLPGIVSAPNLPGNGALWFRKEIDIPAAELIQTIKPAIGQLTGFATVYWNGTKLSDIRYQQYPGAGTSIYFQVPRQNLRPGKNVVAIRFYAPGPPDAFLQAPSNFIAGPLKLAGNWMAKAEYSLPALTPEQLAAMPKPPNKAPEMKASAIFNGVVNPVIPYGIAGVLWYQGESNTAFAYQYRKLFPLFIKDLRDKWNEPTLPFYFCQLANYLPKKTYPAPSEWAELREAQSMALSLPDTAQAVLIDLGESDNVHFRDKVDVADRLARIALARQYGGNLVYSGPVYQSMAIEGNRIRIKFTHTEGGLTAKPLPPTYNVSTLIEKTAPLIPNSPGSQLEGFAISGADQKFVWANARIEGDAVLLWSDQVKQPVAVRYGWAENPTCNLYDGFGLPASPFRTDDFVVSTQYNRFGLPKGSPDR